MDNPFDKEAWLQALLASREEARDYYLNSFNWRGAPMPAGFTGPSYFPPDVIWRKQARLDRDAPGTGQRVQLPTSIGDIREFDVEGTLVFDVEDMEQRLFAYRAVPENPKIDYLFVPFRDATSGNESYGAGRYLDLARDEKSDSYILDFNEAYNPSCAYSPRYNCPYPPHQNHLKVRIEAGERNA